MHTLPVTSSASARVGPENANISAMLVTQQGGGRGEIKFVKGCCMLLQMEGVAEMRGLPGDVPPLGISCRFSRCTEARRVLFHGHSLRRSLQAIQFREVRKCWRLWLFGIFSSYQPKYTHSIHSRCVLCGLHQVLLGSCARNVPCQWIRFLWISGHPGT